VRQHSPTQTGIDDRPLAAWFFIDEGIVAEHRRIRLTRASPPCRPISRLRKLTRGRRPRRALPGGDHVKFDLGVRNFLARRSISRPTTPKPAAWCWPALSIARWRPCGFAEADPDHRRRRLPHRDLACRFIAAINPRPIHELVVGTRRIAEGQFDSPVQDSPAATSWDAADSFKMCGVKRRRFARRARQNRARPGAGSENQMDVCPRSCRRVRL